MARKFPKLTDEIMREIHGYRMNLMPFKAIGDILNKRLDADFNHKSYYEHYNRWLVRTGQKSHLSTEELRLTPYFVKRGCMLHLLDLVRAHGEIVTDRLTGQVVQGGYPNLDIPELETPAVTHVYYHGSSLGSPSATCIGE